MQPYSKISLATQVARRSVNEGKEIVSIDCDSGGEEEFVVVDQISNERRQRLWSYRGNENVSGTRDGSNAC